MVYPIKVLHIINNLNSGGAENMLYKLMKYSNSEKYHHEVISLKNQGVYGEKIEKLGITVHKLNLNKKNILDSLLKSRKIAKNFDVINTWLYHADIFGFILSKILLRKKLIWNIRHSNLDKDVNKSRTLRIVNQNSVLSKFVDLIIYNSNKALKVHNEYGYTGKKEIVIPNGFELNDFKYSEKNRTIIRNKLNIKDTEKVLITVGRWNIQKDYNTLIKALNELNKYRIKFKMIMVGSGLHEKNKDLIELIKLNNLEEKVILLGRQSNIPSLLSAADIYISSSLGESFSNAIGEAMACELACIVTDVGDSSLIVGETGSVVEPQNYVSLYKKMQELLNSKKITRNREARLRILELYDIKHVVNLFENSIIELHNPYEEIENTI